MILRITLLLSLSAALLACAAIDNSACLDTNWETVGFEDGSIGKSLSYADTRQSDCNKQDVQIDMQAYRIGDTEGVKAFCLIENGFDTVSYTHLTLPTTRRV